MKNFSIVYVSILLALVISACGESTISTNEQQKWLKEKQLDAALSDSTSHNCIDNKLIIIKTKETAISVVEPILFDLYGKEKIVNQQPYKVCNIRNYWIIEGSLPKGFKGGTFFIIIDSRNGEIIQLTHGK